MEALRIITLVMLLAIFLLQHFEMRQINKRLRILERRSHNHPVLSE